MDITTKQRILVSRLQARVKEDWPERRLKRGDLVEVFPEKSFMNFGKYRMIYLEDRSLHITKEEFEKYISLNVCPKPVSLNAYREIHRTSVSD